VILKLLIHHVLIQLVPMFYTKCFTL